MIEKAACVGAGNVGRAWAIVFARGGLDVALYDNDQSALQETSLPAIARSVRDLERADLITSADELLGRIRVADSLHDAVADADYVQESVKEDVAVKRAVFHELGAVAGRKAILASSTSAIPGSQFLDAASHPQRCLIVHPVNPPYLIPLVELCASPWTSAPVMEAASTLMRQIGQKPIRLRKEIPGFILNRLQFTLVAEALHLVGEGYCEPDDIDSVLKHGLALRWAFLGPFEVAHLNATAGFQGFIDNLGEMMRSLAADAKVNYAWTPELAAEIHQKLTDRRPVDSIPDAQAWRDRRIMALRKHLEAPEYHGDG